MSLPEQAAFCTDTLDLKVNEKVQPYEWVRKFDLVQSAKRVNLDYAHLPVVSRSVSICDIDGSLYIYGDLPSNDPKLIHSKRRSLHTYFRRKKWTNAGMANFPLGICLQLTITSIEQFEQLQKHALEIELARSTYLLDCTAGLQTEDVYHALRKRAPKLLIHSFDLEKWNYGVNNDESGEIKIPEYNPFPAIPAALSFLTATLREEKNFGEGQEVVHPRGKLPPSYFLRQPVLA